MKRLLSIATITVLMVSGVALAKNTISLTNKRAPRHSAKWDKQFHGISVVLRNKKGVQVGEFLFILPRGTKPDSGKRITADDLEAMIAGNHIKGKLANELSLEAQFLGKYLESFSAQLKPGGEVKFRIKGKNEGAINDWKFDYTGNTVLE